MFSSYESSQLIVDRAHTTDLMIGLIYSKLNQMNDIYKLRKALHLKVYTR